MKNQIKNLIIFSLTILGIGVFNTAKATGINDVLSVTNFNTNNGTLNLIWDKGTQSTMSNAGVYFSTVTSTNPTFPMYYQFVGVF